MLKVRNGPFMLVGARSFGRIAAMRLTAARSPERTLANQDLATPFAMGSLVLSA
jgi:hypothetical protein